ncbi:serine hydrolase domain-containing protein [Echinicola vietnamensis]|uniref:Penicillin-binding protein, beta-lactamase class C n=1 Tax=Echinicola vietnamensis (strain DSM 17526 / LMG 23754 / KMM 6221) TaxID=926556 RepID=L0G2D2_ECHVK|nr:hydrolase [Echinicola vietnamensis]AGA78995.1 penicillin-binding protein, beta-lactamase class C [Echinicola vietnamensis DSM 17526]
MRVIRVIPFYFWAILPMVAAACQSKNAVLHASHPKTAQLDSLFGYLYAEGMFNGAVAVVDHGTLIFRKAYGVANLEDSSVFESQTAMEVASVSKQFTAAAIMDLAQDRKLSISDDIRAYLPEGFPYEGITIKHLLSHTSGMPDYTEYFKAHWPEDQLANNMDIVTYFIEHQPEIKFLPGTDYDYSNTGYVLLAEIVESASGLKLDAYLEKQLFTPYAFQHAGFYRRSEIYNMPHYAPSFRWSKDSCRYVRPEHLPGKAYYYFLSDRLGPGRLSLSVEDLLQWDRLLYRDDFLSSESKAAMFTPVNYKGVETDYGFGWHNYIDDKVGAVSYHTGSWAGNLSYIKRFRDVQSTIILLNNTNSPYMKAIRNAVDAMLTDRTVEPIYPSLKERFTMGSCQDGFDAKQWLEEVDLAEYSFTEEELAAIKDTIHD